MRHPTAAERPGTAQGGYKLGLGGQADELKLASRAAMHRSRGPQSGPGDYLGARVCVLMTYRANSSTWKIAITTNPTCIMPHSPGVRL